MKLDLEVPKEVKSADRIMSCDEAKDWMHKSALDLMHQVPANSVRTHDELLLAMGPHSVVGPLFIVDSKDSKGHVTAIVCDGNSKENSRD